MGERRSVSPAESRHLARSGLADGVREAVALKVKDCLLRLVQRTGVNMPPPDIRYDLAGTSAGQYMRRKTGQHPHLLRFNPYLLALYPDESLQTTIPHEVAHYAVALVHGNRRLRPHGAEWRQMMKWLGVSPERTHEFDVTRVPRRAQRRWTYICSCSTHELSTTRHNRVLGGNRYYCRKCRGLLVASMDAQSGSTGH